MTATLQDAYIGQRFPRGRDTYFVISYRANTENGMQTMHVIDDRTGQDAEFATKQEARAALRALLRPAKRISN